MAAQLSVVGSDGKPIAIDDVVLFETIDYDGRRPQGRVVLIEAGWIVGDIGLMSPVSAPAAECRLLQKAPRPFRILAIDPGASTGWAILEDGVLLYAGADRWEELSFAGHDVAVIERPTVYPPRTGGKRVDPQKIITLAILAGRLAERIGGDVEWVEPRTWKGNISKEICHARLMAALTVDERRVIDQKLSKKARGDMLDAVALGKWRWRCRRSR